MEPPLNHTAASGLSSAQAAARLAADGPNELPGHGPRNVVVISRDVMSEPMFLLLLAAALIYIVLGDAREAIALSASLLLVLVVTIVQERRTETALARLRDLSSPLALVLRDGVQRRIPGRDVVCGDLLLLSEGDRVPADGVLLSATGLSVDESILTGESLPVEKTADRAGNAELQRTDGASQVFSGSLVVRGFGTARVTAIGTQTGIGRIGRALVTLDAGVTPLYSEVRGLVRWLASVGLLICVAIMVIYALKHQDWLGGVLAGITVAMGLLPEEFPVVLTVFLAMGAWRISRSGVLTRRMPAIETIGAVTLLAVDKTGTLTENRMRLVVVDSLQQHFDLRQSDTVLDVQARHVLHTAMAASESDAFDPMEHAIRDAATTHAAEQVRAFAGLQLVREYDLTPELLAVTHVWQPAAGGECTVAVKGAPETVFGLCGLAADEQQHLMERVAGYARDGLRVLAVAAGRDPGTALPDRPHDFALQLLGLVCLADPLRADVPERLSECRKAGIRVVMITGDHAGTALSIAQQAGIDTSAGALTGAQVAALPPAELAARTRTVNVFARMAPEQKLALVQAFRSNGEIVAMTGDGVNDAPALKAAHVGVAMGGRGTEVARAAASLVLVNDDFASLVGAVRLGRRIYQNIQHAMSFIMAVHIPIAGLGLLPVLFDLPLLLFPLHVMFLEFVIDPACSFVFEADSGSADLMERSPRSSGARLFDQRTIRRSVARGTLVLVADLAVYLLALQWLPDTQARALTFCAAVVGSLLLIFLSRARRTANGTAAGFNAMRWWVTGFALLAMALAVFVPPVAAVFRFTAPPAGAVIGICVAGLVVAALSARPHLRSA